VGDGAGAVAATVGSTATVSAGGTSVAVDSVAAGCCGDSVGSWADAVSVGDGIAAAMAVSSGGGVVLTPPECRHGRISRMRSPTRIPASTRSDGIQSGSPRR
jgi:hypothetical protein